MLIPSIYATSLRTQSLRLDRFPSDQNTRWRLPFHFSPLRDNEFLVSPHLPNLYPYMRVDDRRDATHVRQHLYFIHIDFSTYWTNQPTYFIIYNKQVIYQFTTFILITPRVKHVNLQLLFYIFAS